MQNLILSDSIHMGSLEHILAVVVTLAIIFIVYLFRNYFMEHKTADRIFRWVLAFALMGSEFILRFDKVYGKAPIVMTNLPIPLCGMLLWISAVALLSNSTRIMKRFYPIFLTAASLSLVVCEIDNAHFPDFRAFQYFICHGGFLLGALYFVFTKKINKFTIKDYGWSCMIVGLLGGIMSFLFAVNPNIFPDEFYVMGFGLDALRPIYDAIGQIGFSLLYMATIASIMLIYSLITYYVTRRRKDEEEAIVSYKSSSKLDYLSRKTSPLGRKALLVVHITAMLYLMAWQAVMGNMSIEGTQDPLISKDPTIIIMAWILGLMWFIGIALFVLNEVIYYYGIQKKREESSGKESTNRL